MSEASDQRSREFLKVSSQFKLGALVTESSHPITANLSDVARQHIARALDLLFQVDRDVLETFRTFVESGRVEQIAEILFEALKNGGRIFFTGCGATGRLSIQLVSIWRDFWQQQIGSKARRTIGDDDLRDLENRALSVMAGGDFALIKSVEGFEDFATFGKKQIGDLGVCGKDVVFAITEGGETSFVIGTAWKAVETGAKVFFVYNNPDAILCEHVQRSREVIEDARIEKINLTTGPMAITGSTRMQATSVQLGVMLTILESVVRLICREQGLSVPSGAPREFLSRLQELHATLRSPEILNQLAQLVSLEESVYRSGHKNSYFADRFGIDVLTDTTERSPTYCTPPFRKFDDAAAAESWSFLFLPEVETPNAWERLLKRKPRCVEWNEAELRGLVGDDKAPRFSEIVRKINCAELMRFRIGLDGLECRRLNAGDSAIAILSADEVDSLRDANGFYQKQLDEAAKAGVKLGLIYFGTRRIEAEFENQHPRSVIVRIPIPETDLLLDGVTRLAVKLLLNALSTCTMVRLGRVMGNTMIWVVASNLKLIDRATRYIRQLTGLEYEGANRLLFEAVEYIEPRMKADQAYPPVVGLCVMRAKYGISNEDAERKWMAELG